MSATFCPVLSTNSSVRLFESLILAERVNSSVEGWRWGAGGQVEVIIQTWSLFKPGCV